MQPKGENANCAATGSPRVRVAAGISLLASQCYNSSAAAQVLLWIASGMAAIPLAYLAWGLLEGYVVLSIPLIAMLFAGMVGFRVARKWGSHAD